MSENLSEQENAGNTPEPSAVELQAMEMGWKPKDQWQGDESDFIDARNFVRNKSLFDRIDTLSRKVKDQDKALHLLKEHHQKVEEATRTAVIAELKKQKKQAIEEGEADRVIEIDDEIAKQRAQEAFEKSAPKEEAPQLHPNFVAWVERNSWYAQDPELRQDADVIGITYRNTHPDKTADEVLAHVATRIKKLHPEKFQNENRNQPSMVASQRGNRQVKETKDTFVLTPEEERVMNTFVRTGALTKEEYIAGLRKIKGE